MALFPANRPINSRNIVLRVLIRTLPASDTLFAGQRPVIGQALRMAVLVSNYGRESSERVLGELVD